MVTVEGNKLAMTSASTAADVVLVWEMDEMELCMVPLVLVEDDSDEDTDITSSSFGCRCCSCWSHSMIDEVSVQGLGVTIVMAVGFLGVVADGIAEAAISAEEQACNVVC